MDIQELLKAIKVPVITWIGQSIQWQTYTSTVSGSTGSQGTYAETIFASRYYVLGKSCHVITTKRIDNKGSWSGNLQILAPVAAANYQYTGYGGHVIADSATAPKGWLMIRNGTVWTFEKAWNAGMVQWTDIAVNDWIVLRFEYEIA